jgi:uncharacterized protein
MKNDDKIFINALYLLVFILAFVCILGVIFITNKSFIILKLGIAVIILILIIYILAVLWCIYILYKLLNNKRISEMNYKILKNVTEAAYPLILFIAKCFKKDIDSVRRVYAKINNFLVKAKTIKIESKDLLILLPHCLQNSECSIKITNDIRNCKMCGKCDIKQIIELCDKYNVTAVVATGGTLAREWIKKLKPKSIIAVACERDLASGINEVKLIPVIGVLNDRPNGPCHNTKVSIENLEEAIKFFIEED